MKLALAFQLHKTILALTDKEAATVLMRVLETNPAIVERALASSIGSKVVPETEQPIWRVVISDRMVNRIGTIKQARQMWSLGLAEAKAWTEGVATVAAPPPGIIVENVTYETARSIMRQFDQMGGYTTLAIIRMSDPWEFIKP